MINKHHWQITVVGGQENMVFYSNTQPAINTHHIIWFDATTNKTNFAYGTIIVEEFDE